MATTKFFPLLAGLCACCFAPLLTAANSSPSAQPLVAVYYSFETSPSDDAFSHMQSELARILAPTGMRMTWRSIDLNHGGENFPEVVVVRFRGACQMTVPNIYSELGPETAIHELAETQRSDGKMLPFGDVECDQLRRYLAPSIGNERLAVRNAAFGRAMARVLAHEIFHMLTGSMIHAKQGIFRAAHSREELTATSFDFAPADTQRLKQWVARSVRALEAISPAIGTNTGAEADFSEVR